MKFFQKGFFLYLWRVLWFTPRQTFGCQQNWIKSGLGFFANAIDQCLNLWVYNSKNVFVSRWSPELRLSISTSASNLAYLLLLSFSDLQWNGSKLRYGRWVTGKPLWPNAGLFAKKTRKRLFSSRMHKNNLPVPSKKFIETPTLVFLKKFWSGLSLPEIL